MELRCFLFRSGGIARGCIFFFFKQKTAYELRISDSSSDVCSSDLSARSADDRLPEIVIVLDDMRETVATRAFGLDGLGIGNFVGHLHFLRTGVLRISIHPS